MKKLNALLLCLIYSTQIFGSSTDLSINSPAPTFKLKTHEGKDFDLESRRGTWTVLYFYPKAETPGCTKQACAFRDNIKKIRNLEADVFGISTDNLADQAAFHKNHKLNFTLLADDKSEVSTKYGTKIALIGVSKRWTFIINPELVIKSISRDVDPILDASRVATEIEKLQKEK